MDEITNYHKRGVVAQRLERKTLLHEVVGSNTAVVNSSVLPKGWGSDLHLGQFHRAHYTYTTMCWTKSQFEVFCLPKPRDSGNNHP